MVNLVSCTLGAVLTPTPPSLAMQSTETHYQSANTVGQSVDTVIQSDNKVEQSTDPSPALRRPERSVQLEDSLLQYMPINQYKSRHTSDVVGVPRRQGDYRPNWQSSDQAAELSDQQLSWQLEPQVGKRPKRLPGPAQLVEAAIESAGHTAASSVLARDQAESINS